MKLNSLCFLFALLFGQWAAAQSTGTFLTRPGTRFEAITWDANGDIFSLDYYSGEVFRIGTNGNVQVVATGLSGPAGGAVDGQGSFFFSELNTGRIFRLMPDNSSHVFATGLAGPAGIALHPSGDTLVVACYSDNSIRKVALSDSSVHPFAIGGGLNGPDGLVFAANGDLISVNFNNNQVHRVDPQGNVTQLATVSGSTNTGYIVRRGSEYFISGFYSHQIWRMDDAGTVTLLAGTGTAGYQDGPLATAQFTLPNGIALNPAGDSLLVAEGGTGGYLRWIPVPEVVTGLAGAETRGSHLRVQMRPLGQGIRVALHWVGTGDATVGLYDLEGREVGRLHTGELAVGEHEWFWERPAGLPAGTYTCRVQGADTVLHQKFVLLR